MNRPLQTWPSTKHLRRAGAVLRRLAAAAWLCAGAVGAVGLVFASAAHADTSGAQGGPSARAVSSLTGYSATVEGLAVQVAFNIPGLFPLPGDNLIEADLPFARTLVTNGPVITAQGTPYWPGDILGNFGSLVSLFDSQAPPLPNDPLQAEAQYPPSPSHGESSTFGGNPPAGSPLAPDVFSGTANAGLSGATAVATLADLEMRAPSSPTSSMLNLGPLPSGLAGALGAAAGPAIDLGQIQSTNQVSIGDASVSGVATTVLKAIDIAGVLDISQIDSSVSSTSDGNQGNPSASLHMLGVTVEGQPAYIDDKGVHVSGQTIAPGGLTPAEAQNVLDTTFAQDGISVRLLDPATNTNGTEGTANAGGLVVSLTHSFAVPYIPGSPTIPAEICDPPGSQNNCQGLGDVGLPAGTYTATTSITLGGATSDVQASVAPSESSSSGGSIDLGGGGTGLGLGLGGLGTDIGIPEGSFGSLPASTSPSTGASSSPVSLGARAANRLPFGIPAPLGWVIVGIVLCVIFAYPMLLAARWQFLSGGR